MHSCNLIPKECVKVDQNVRFSGRHGDLPLRELVGATLCGRPYLRNSTLAQPCLIPLHLTRQNMSPRHRGHTRKMGDIPVLLAHYFYYYFCIKKLKKIDFYTIIVTSFIYFQLLFQVIQETERVKVMHISLLLFCRCKKDFFKLQ